MAPRTSAMGSRSTLSRFLFQNRITGTVKEIATAHEVNRQNVVKEILVHVFLMAKFKILTGATTVGEAQSQYISGHGADQAAHCVPGQIRANGQAIQNLLTASDDLHVALDNLFGATDEIDANFNKADSSSESSGLRTAFGNACNLAARSGAIARFNRAYEFYPYINTAFTRYKAEGMQGFRAAIANQQSLISPAKDDVNSRRERIFITETYLATLASAPTTLETVMGLYPEDLWREYRQIAA